MCGEKFYPLLLMVSHKGSPPRVRGKVIAYRICSSRWRITPACAGKRYDVIFFDEATQDHPRVCGEKLCKVVHVPRVGGSPPRVRGKVIPPTWWFVNSRITPACAGKSRYVTAMQLANEDHPRVCGEKLYGIVHTLRVDRITPACAGKSTGNITCSLPVEDHPRVCGEKYNRKEADRWEEGSPPRVRGKVWHADAAAGLWRITPACAGKSSCGHFCPAYGEDHPRVCGEKAGIPSASANLRGSPPRVRGKAYRYCDSGQAGGITPACAGKRNRRRGGGVCQKDHPRVCGEKQIMGMMPR